MLRPIGVILAGGASTRMGTDKSAMEVAGRPMIEWVASALAPACERVVVAGGSPRAGFEVIEDPVTDRRGPLSGLVAALEAVTDRRVILVATDQPWLRSATVEALASRATDLPSVVVDHDGARQPTLAVYPPSVLPVALDELLGLGSIQSMLDRTAFEPLGEDVWSGWGEDGRSWFSADSPDRLEVGLRRFGPPA
jgi:molybdopterin-guanine dinucleotide biosynthesis protein A